MPGLDGTGPMGMGPMTGGARGWCNPYSWLYTGGLGYGAPYGGPLYSTWGRPAYAPPVAGWPTLGYGLGARPFGLYWGRFWPYYGYGWPWWGAGRGRGIGLGIGRRRWW